MLSDYYQHVLKYPKTLLTKFLANFYMKTRQGRHIRLVAMGSIFRNGLYIDKKYDLKVNKQWTIPALKTPKTVSISYARFVPRKTRCVGVSACLPNSLTERLFSPAKIDPNSKPYPFLPLCENGVGVVMVAYQFLSRRDWSRVLSLLKRHCVESREETHCGVFFCFCFLLGGWMSSSSNPPSPPSQPPPTTHAIDLGLGLRVEQVRDGGGEEEGFCNVEGFGYGDGLFRPACVG